MSNWKLVLAIGAAYALVIVACADAGSAAALILIGLGFLAMQKGGGK